MLLKLKASLRRTAGSLWSILPMLLAMIGLIGLFETVVTPEMLHNFFNGSTLKEIVIGVLSGAVSVGQPFLSYAVGGELLNEGVSLYAVTAFILSFVTLGLVQLPLEWALFGTRFTVVRNLLSLLFAFLISVATVYVLGWFQ
ncbi:MAG: permease [Epsilonproteobacteria bacterium 4484_20]|nr:MAG: permease [Epsilonproteobacteria bacterium 4484_20]